MKSFEIFKKLVERSRNEINFGTDCAKNPRVDLRIVVDFLGVSLICLHPKYNSPFIKVTVGESNFNFDMLVDHLKIRPYFGKIALGDISGYPNTQHPEEYKQLTWKELVSLPVNDLYSVVRAPDMPSFDVYAYKPGCPKIPKDIENTFAYLQIYIGEVWMTYVHELSLRRIIDYMIWQLVYSLIPHDEDVQENEAAIGTKKIIDFLKPFDFLKFVVIISINFYIRLM